jgi:hypothetical protein
MLRSTGPGERRQKGEGRGEALCIVEKQWRGGDQSEHEIACKKIKYTHLMQSTEYYNTCKFHTSQTHHSSIW